MKRSALASLPVQQYERYVALKPASGSENARFPQVKQEALAPIKTDPDLHPSQRNCEPAIHLVSSQESGPGVSPLPR